VHLSRITSAYYLLLAWFSRAVEFLAERLLRREVVAGVVLLLFSSAMFLKAVPWIIDPAVVAGAMLALLWLLDRQNRRGQDGGRQP
jgi:hypothetical protein